jgi:hypothetical protein
MSKSRSKRAKFAKGKVNKSTFTANKIRDGGRDATADYASRMLPSLRLGHVDYAVVSKNGNKGG